MSINVCEYPPFLFGFESAMGVLIVLISDHCLSIYFTMYIRSDANKKFVLQLSVIIGL